MLSLIASIILITPSGAFSPGPLTASAIALGASKGWRAGLYVAVGHMLFELPYVYALTYLFSRVDVGPYKTYMALAATAFIIYLPPAERCLEDSQGGAADASQIHLRQPSRRRLSADCVEPLFPLVVARRGRPNSGRIGDSAVLRLHRGLRRSRRFRLLLAWPNGYAGRRRGAATVGEALRSLSGGPRPHAPILRS